eukprot:scaffold21456_cov56-Phaeocystis_antarctica.AAC.1
MATHMMKPPSPVSTVQFQMVETSYSISFSAVTSASTPSPIMRNMNSLIRWMMNPWFEGAIVRSTPSPRSPKRSSRSGRCSCLPKKYKFPAHSNPADTLSATMLWPSSESEPEPAPEAESEVRPMSALVATA